MTPDAQDAAPFSDTPATDGGDVRGEVERLNLEKAQLFERLARAQAEFQNSRRRLEQDQDQALQYANQSLLKSLLPLMDNLERALSTDAGRGDTASLLAGVQVVRDQFEAVLKAQRVEVLAPQPGDAFDPARHEALMQQPSAQPAGTVAMLLGKGYALAGRTLRPAQVAVAKGA